jgi:hypothetical protein
MATLEAEMLPDKSAVQKHEELVEDPVCPRPSRSCIDDWAIYPGCVDVALLRAVTPRCTSGGTPCRSRTHH